MTDSKSYLDFILEKLNTRIQRLDVQITEGRKDIEEMHNYYWENYTEMDQYGYENFDNHQALFQQMNATQEQSLLRRRLRKMLDSPYFGRVNFRYEDEEDVESFYIGIANFAEESGRVPLIYDWRAPVSSLFYDYDKGPAFYQAPGGQMNGEVTSKWQYKIRGGRLIYEFECDTKIDDEILKAELGANGDVQLKNIIRTIQREQNAIIRNTKDRIMIIQGAAGSGKTSIALHRIAYLLYHDRKHLSSSNVLVLSPNTVFSDYISHILPELGEENIQEMSYDLFAYRELKPYIYDCEDKYDLIEQQMVSPEVSASYHQKQSKVFIGLMEGYLAILEDSLMLFHDISWKGGYTKSESELIQLFYNKFTQVPLLSRMDAVMEYMVDEYETLRGRNLSEEERIVIQEEFQNMYETKDLYQIYNSFLEDFGYTPLPDVPLERRILPYEDVYPMLYMKYRLLIPKKHQGIKHLIVDEMQDYSYLQYSILEMLFSCRMTILGDRAQTMDSEIQDALTFLPEIFGKQMRKIILNRSYRNTSEITSYANALTGLTDVEIFERHGKPVVEEHFSGNTDGFKEALECCLSNLKLSVDSGDDYETAAILTMTETEAKQAYEYLKKRIAVGDTDAYTLSYLDRNSSRFEKGLTVTTFYLAKGLEFDQVFTLAREAADKALSLQAKYICATRALHELYMYELSEDVSNLRER